LLAGHGLQEGSTTVLQARGTKPSGSGISGACIPGLGLEGSSIVSLEACGIKPLGDGNSVPICQYRLPVAMAAGTGAGQVSLGTVWVSRSTVLWHYQHGGNTACCFTPSVTGGAVGALGPAYTEVMVSLAFQTEGSRGYSMGEHGAPSSCVCLGAGLATKH
jgi:hypothetical protein